MKQVERCVNALFAEQRLRHMAMRVGSVGHCGHTGQFVFVDPNADRYAIILTDATRCHDITFDDDRYDLVMQMRADLCNAAKHDLAL